MELQDREVTLKLKSRPLRCAYLVRDREDLLDAIALYTHTWGGCANAIFPMPNSVEEIDILRDSLEWMNPDYIFVPREGMPSLVSELLENLPILRRPISRTDVEQHVNNTGNNQLRLLAGSLSHIDIILSAIYQNPVEDSNIYLVRNSETFNLDIALNLGLPSKPYLNYLLTHLGAKCLTQPHSIETLLKTLLTAAKFLNPATFTLHKTKHSGPVSFYSMQTNDHETLCLFLDDGKDLGIATAFWNCRWFFPCNKIFLPREEFLKNIKIHVLHIIKCMPNIRALYVTTPYDREEALELHAHLKGAFIEAGREILIKIYYKNFSFDWVLGTLSFGKVADFTRTVTSEGCVRFDVSTPPGHERRDYIIGYDAEVKFISGRKLFSPKTLTGSRLLTNELWRIERFEKDKDNFRDVWLRSDLTVRASEKGISGLALPGKECSFYIHPSDVVITQQLKDVGLELKPNKHTRYAQGLVKRFGGLKKVLNLINDGGFDILSALASRHKEERKSYQTDIVGFLVKRCHLKQQDAEKLIREKMQPLLSSGLIRRGYSLECPHCNLYNWFLLEEVREFLECRGCAEEFQMPLNNIQFSFEPNELAAQLIQEGGLAVLITAALLKRIPDSNSDFIQFGGDLFPIGSKVNTNEVDLFWLTESAFIISECKSFFVLGGEQNRQVLDKRIGEIKESLLKNIDLAKRIGAKTVLLGVATNVSEIPQLFGTISDLTKIATNQGIGLHLALNGKIYLRGDENGFEPRKIRISDLLIEEEMLPEECSVGESPENYGGMVGSNGLFDKEILKQWASELVEKV